MNDPRIVAIDWSGAFHRPEHAIWLAEAQDGRVRRLESGRDRAAIAEHLIEEAMRSGEMVVGLDFAFSLPRWFLEERGLSGAPELWELAEREGERWLAECTAPFWGRPGKSCPPLREHFRRTERDAPAVGGTRPKSVFQIGGAGAVGTGSLRGMPVLRQLRQAGFAIWPFDPPRLPVVVEIYPRSLSGSVNKSDPSERAAYLTAQFPELDDVVRARAVGSDDAFDALVSALVMDAHAAELTCLPVARDDHDLREGRIWLPTTFARAAEPGRPGVVTDAPGSRRRAIEPLGQGEERPGGTSRSATGVLLADDFRENLIVDRFDPALAMMRGAKRDAMRSENSEDVLTWNCFRALRRVSPAAWLPRLAERAFGRVPHDFADQDARVELWRTLAPPPALRRFQNDEGMSEIDVVIETDAFVWCIEAKYRSDISTRTTNNPERDQVLRNVDVGSYHAGVRRFYFSLLVLDERRSTEGVRRLETYRDDTERLRRALPHRPDGLANLDGLGLLTWRDVASVLDAGMASAQPEPERAGAQAVLGWLQERGILSVT